MSFSFTKALIATVGHQLLVAGMPPSGQNGQAAPSLEEMKHWLHLAFASYCPEADITHWDCGVHCDAVTGLSMLRYIKTDGLTNNTATAAFVAYDKQAEDIVLSFKGTDMSVAKLEDWYLNLKYWKKYPLPQYPDVGIHRGFWDAWQGLKAEILTHIEEIKVAHSGVTAIRVTGHSLGGAMATNAAMDLKLNHGFVTSVVNFGSPRPGDVAYHNLILAEVPHWRVTHHNDPVVHLPKRYSLLPPFNEGFHHASTEIHFPEKTGLEFKVCDGSGEDKSCADSKYADSIDDHTHYLDFSTPEVYKTTDSCKPSSNIVV